MKYRLLDTGESIQTEDEVLLLDSTTWKVLDLDGVDRIASHDSYDPSFHMPMRRKVKEEPIGRVCELEAYVKHLQEEAKRCANDYSRNVKADVERIKMVERCVIAKRLLAKGMTPEWIDDVVSHKGPYPLELKHAFFTAIVNHEGIPYGCENVWK